MTELLSKPKHAKNFVEMRRQGKRNIQVWRGWVDGEQAITQWGVLDGKIQQTIDTPGPKGKPGTKSFIPPEQSAKDKIGRDVTAKAKRGYKLMNELKGDMAKPLSNELGEVDTGDAITFHGPLPQNTCFSKPVNSIPDERVQRLCNEISEYGGPAVEFTVKVNGMCHLVSRDCNGDVWIQKRGKLEVENDKYPHLVEEFEALLPCGSMFLCEFFLGDGRSRKDFSDMQRIANSLSERALKLQKEIGLVHAYVFRIPFWKYSNMEETTVCREWLDHLEALIDGYQDQFRPGGVQPGFSDSDFVIGVVRVGSDYDEVMKEMVEEEYEGYVMYRTDKPLGEKHLSFLGQPDRPAVCWKVKLELEDDFIIEWDPNGAGTHCSRKCLVPDAEASRKQVSSGKCCVCGKGLQSSGAYGSGKNSNRVGAMSLFQLDHQGVKQYICEVSGGITDRKRAAIAKEGILIDVAEIAYQSRSYIRKGDDTNALFLPRIVRFRKGKELHECVNKEL